MTQARDAMTERQTELQDSDDRQRARVQSLDRAGPPTQVPGYESLQFLGAGAYGEVWLAVDRNTGRRVAIKFYAHRSGLDWSLLSREVEKLSFLFSDRHVVQLLDVGWEAEPPYYIMEYLDRGSLEDLLRRGTLSVPEAIAMIREVAVGLLHSHGKGVLHCDLKPANVLLGTDEKPRLADFGQSRLSHEQTPALGTLFYMAPEQADLEAAPDARWDVYALGALFYCMLTGKPPYKADHAVRYIEATPKLKERLERYREMIRTAPRPSEHRQVPGVDRALAEIIERCLAPDPEKRFSNVQAFLDALDARAIRRARRPLLVLGAVGPALLLAVMTSFAWSSYGVSVRQTEATVTRRALESNRFAAQFVAETVARQIDHRWQILEVAASSPQLIELLQQAEGAPLGSPQWQALQTWIEVERGRHAEVASTSWFINSDDGTQLARSPFDARTVGENYAFRDYFHGLGHDLPRDEIDGTNVEPIREVHRSNVFQSEAERTGRMVAFSVPVFARPGQTEGTPVIGVLAMTVELGHFAELRPDDQDDADQIPVLVDSQADASNVRGAVLEHPFLAARLQAVRLKEPGATVPAVYLSKDDVQLLEELRPLKQRIQEIKLLEGPLNAAALEPEQRAARAAEMEELVAQFQALSARDDHRDPLSAEDERFVGRWIAAFEPVLIEGRPPAAQDTGWAVIVQERYNNAMLPVRALGEQLVRQGLVALGVVVALVTALWGFVVIVLNESPRRGWLARVRRRAGLTGVAGSPSPLGASSLGSTDRRTVTSRSSEQ